jgi:hypothetical protein
LQGATVNKFETKAGLGEKAIRVLELEERESGANPPHIHENTLWGECAEQDASKN